MRVNTDGSSAKKVTGTACCFMGLSHILYFKQYLKGAMYALIELIFIALIPFFIRKIQELITLPFDRANDKFPVFMLIDGILVISIILIFAALYFISVKSAKAAYVDYCRTTRFKQTSMWETANNAFTLVGLAPCIIMLLVFVVVPLVFSICVAFTNFAGPDHAVANDIDWVGGKNFKDLLFSGSTWSKGFARIAIWTLIWAFFSTFTCYFGGLLVAVQLKESGIKLAGIFRFIFILPYAVPAVITMLVWRNMLNGTFGIVNRTLATFGITGPQWLGDATLAKVMCIVINLWAGFGYFMMLTMGTMTAIGNDLFEAAKIDGANNVQVLRHITLPLVMYQTMPLIIMSFMHNINNFGIIYFLTGGSPTVADSTITRAGGTDILVTWIYNLTIGLLKYNYASVIAVLIFVVLAPFAVYQFMNTKAYKEGEV